MFLSQLKDKELYEALEAADRDLFGDTEAENRRRRVRDNLSRMGIGRTFKGIPLTFKGDS